MKMFITILLILAMLGTLGVLFAGILGMARGGSAGTSNKLMQWRIVLQAGALVLLVVLFSLAR